jgi:hypothetical protein
MASRVVLDPEIADPEPPAQSRRGEERRESRATAEQLLAVHRQQLAVAPEVSRPRGDGVAGEGVADALQVVDGKQATPARVASRDRLFRLLSSALATSQADDMPHGFLHAEKEKGPRRFRRGPLSLPLG